MRHIKNHVMFPVAFIPKEHPRHVGRIYDVVEMYGIEWRKFALENDGDDSVEVDDLIDAPDSVFEFADPDDQGIRGPMTAEAAPLVAIIVQTEAYYNACGEFRNASPIEHRIREVLWITGTRVGGILADGGGPLLRYEEQDDGTLEPEGDCLESLARFNRGLAKVRKSIRDIEAAHATLREVV